MSCGGDFVNCGDVVVIGGFEDEIFFNIGNSEFFGACFNSSFLGIAFN